jgi:hypothetical protein
LITDFDDNDYVILREHKNKLSISNAHPILIDELLKYDFRPDRLNIALNWTIDNFNERYVNVSKIIKDFILIYVSSSIARYNPKLSVSPNSFEFFDKIN